MSERRSTRSAAALKVAPREHDARLSLMFETVPVILYTYGVEDGERYRFTSVNQPFLAATGLTRDDVVGRLVDEVIPEPSRSLVLAKYRHAIRERATVRWLETTVYPAGQKVAEVTITPIFDDSGRCTELFGTVYDLTELEQIKSELRARDERIDELATLNRRLDKVTRAKSEFLASMSHELRTPLNAIIGFSDLLVDQLGDRLTPAQQRYFRNVRDAGHHLLELINEVLDLSKVEAGRVELRPDTIALPTLVEPVVASARADAAVRGVAFDTDVPSDGEVRVDAGRLGRSCTTSSPTP